MNPIDKYIRKRISVESNVIDVHNYTIGMFDTNVRAVFSIKFSILEWVAENISNEYVIITDGGVKRWYKDGLQHRDDDLPATECPRDGKREWYRRGQKHREGDKPAVIDCNGSKQWFKYGTRHRDGDKPATEYKHVDVYYKFGREHRDGKPAVVWNNGSEEWYQFGDVHRDDGPAIIVTPEQTSIMIYGDRLILGEYYYLKGVKYTKELYYNKINGTRTNR